MVSAVQHGVFLPGFLPASPVKETQFTISGQTAGNLNILSIGWIDGTEYRPPKVKDQNGNNYYSGVAVGDYDSTYGLCQQILYYPNIPGGNNTLYIVFPNPVLSVDVRWAEFSGVTYPAKQGTLTPGLIVGQHNSGKGHSFRESAQSQTMTPPLWVTSNLCRIDETSNLDFLVYGAAYCASAITGVTFNNLLPTVKLGLLDISSLGNAHSWGEIKNQLLVSADYNQTMSVDYICQLLVFNASGKTIPPFSS